MQNPTSYPVQLSIDYPDRDLDRLSTLLRPLFALPIVIVLASVSGSAMVRGDEAAGSGWGGAGGLLFLGPLLMILFRRRYPRWWFDWNVALLRFANRIAAYLALMDDRYPSTEERQSVSLEVPYPDAPGGVRDIGHGGRRGSGPRSRRHFGEPHSGADDGPKPGGSAYDLPLGFIPSTSPPSAVSSPPPPAPLPPEWRSTTAFPMDRRHRRNGLRRTSSRARAGGLPRLRWPSGIPGPRPPRRGGSSSG